MIGVLAALAALAVVEAVLVFRTLRAAAAAERRYRALAESSPQSGLMVLDGDRTVVRFEGLAFERQGWRPGDLVGRPLADAIPPERMAALEPYIEAALRGESGEFDWRSLRSDAVFRTDSVPFRSRGREIDHVMLVIRDVSAERALQARLEEQGQFFSAVLAEAAGRVQVCDAHGRLVSFVADPYGLHPALVDDMHPLEWAERFGLRHPDGTPLGPHETPLLRALRGEQVTDVEFRVPTTGGERSMLVSGGPVDTPDGRRLGAVITMADLTARYDAEAQLRRSEERHRRVVESMSDCVFETDSEGRWTYLNDAWEQATGFAVAESLGRPAWSFVHPDDRAEHARAFAPLLRGEQPAVRLSHRFLTATGAERSVAVEARAVTGWDGLPTGFVGVMRDVTPERRAECHAAAERALVAALEGSEDLGSVAEPALAAVGGALGWDAAELWTMSPDELVRRRAAWAAAEGFEEFLAVGAQHAFEVGDGLPGQAWMAREPVWRDVAGGGPEPPRSAAAGVRSTVALPLRLDGRTIAVVTLVSRVPRERDAGMDRLLETLTAHVAQFMQRRAAERRAARRTDDLRTLARVAHELASQTDMYAARHGLCAAVREVTGASSVVLWEPGEAEDTLAVSAAVGAAVHGMAVGLGEHSAAGAAYLTCDPMFVPDVAGDVRVALNWHDVTGAVSGAWFPAVHDGRCVGVIAVGWPQARAELSERDEELLRLLSAEAAVTIHRTALLDRLRATARTDALTGLPNRRVWEEDLARELARASRHGGDLCLVMLDLDRFKAFNDAQGHPAGDRLLAATAAAWRPLMRETDTLARYGGEEFAVLLPHSDRPGAEAVVERLLAAVPLGQTASAGIAVWDGDESAEDLLARADAALYEAKHAGRARAVTAC